VQITKTDARGSVCRERNVPGRFFSRNYPRENPNNSIKVCNIVVSRIMLFSKTKEQTLFFNPTGGLSAPGDSAASFARLPLHATEQSLLILNPIGGMPAPGDSAAGCARLPLHTAEQSAHS
jgi:hypothetical protein